MRNLLTQYRKVNQFPTAVLTSTHNSRRKRTEMRSLVNQQMALLQVATIHPPGIIYEDYLGKDGKNGVKNRECSQSDGLMFSRYKSDHVSTLHLSRQGQFTMQATALGVFHVLGKCSIFLALQKHGTTPLFLIMFDEFLVHQQAFQACSSGDSAREARRQPMAWRLPHQSAARRAGPPVSSLGRKTHTASFMASAPPGAGIRSRQGKGDTDKQ